LWLEHFHRPQTAVCSCTVCCAAHSSSTVATCVPLHCRSCGSLTVYRSTGLQSTGLQSTGLQSTGLRSTGLQSTGLQSTGLQSTGLQSTGLQSTGLQVYSLQVYRSTVYRSTVYRSTVYRSTGLQVPCPNVWTVCCSARHKFGSRQAQSFPSPAAS